MIVKVHCMAIVPGPVLDTSIQDFLVLTTSFPVSYCPHVIDDNWKLREVTWLDRGHAACQELTPGVCRRQICMADQGRKMVHREGNI